MGLITIKTFDNSIDTHLIKGKLESEGIQCYIFDENMISLNPIYNITLGGIKLKINEKDLTLATEIITNWDQALLTDDSGNTMRCPECDSDNLYVGYKSMKGIKGFFSILVAFIFTIFPLYYKTLTKCKSCGHEFKTE